MEDLTGRFEARLVPSSMSAGNTQADPNSYKLSMTAPGGPSILPPSPTTDNLLDLAGDAAGSQIPVSHPGSREKVTVQSSRWGGGTFSPITTGDGGWEQT